MRIFRCALGVSFSIAATTAYAGGWTQDPGQGLAILSGSYYAADNFYTNSGHSQSQPAYSKYELNPYLEYGLYDGITAGTNLSLQRVHTDDPGETAWNLGDSEFFLRGRLYQDEHFAIAIEPMVKLPSPQSDNIMPRIGSDHPDAGMGLSGGYGFSAWGLNHFIDLDTQYRYRFGLPKDQVRVNLTAGIGVTQRLSIMPQIFTTWRTGNNPNEAFTESSEDDYDLVRLQLSALYKLTDATQLQVGGFSDIDGKNTGAGNGGLLSVWQKF